MTGSVLFVIVYLVNEMKVKGNTITMLDTQEAGSYHENDID